MLDSQPRSSRSRRSRRRRGGQMSDINVTPFVDVMLVLLIIFMIAAPMLVTGVSVDLPDSKAGALEPEAAPLQITIDASGMVFIDDDAVPQTDLSARLADIAAESGGAADRRVLVRADAVLGYGTVMKVIGDVTFAGFKKIALISEDVVVGDRSS